MVAISVVLMTSPVSASLQDIQWSGQSYHGNDTFYGQAVEAFETGSTANLAILVRNDAGSDVAITSAKIEIDGLDEFTTTDFPVSIENGKSDFVNFSFAIPTTALNSTVYDYMVYVRYDKLDDNKEGREEASEVLGVGNGVTTVFYLAKTPVVADTLTIEVDGTATTAYTLDQETGKITFTTAPDVGELIRAISYRYYQSWTNWGANLAVYSSDQSAAMSSSQELDAVANYADYAGVLHGVPAETRGLLAQSDIANDLGDQAYAAGSFEDAKTHYEGALELLKEAIDTDDDLVKENTNMPAPAAWLAGLGIFIFGFGMLIYALKWNSP